MFRRFSATNTFLAIVLALILFGAIMLLCIGHLNQTDYLSDKPVKDLQPLPSEDLLKSEVKLYFNEHDDKWITEDRKIFFKSDRIEAKIAKVIKELINGPEFSNVGTIPEGTQLIGVFFDNNITYLDFSEALINNHPGGTTAEILTIYSIVNSVMDNFNEIKGVKILVMGKEIETLKGHIDTRYPFTYREKP